ncbi:MAG: site-specific integrase [Chloroflexota bacterium]|nr:site-specific integrase [Chloroflexota bacterium]
MPRKIVGRRTKKRANGEGTITRRKDGRWQAALYRTDGTRKFYYGATRDDVNDKLVRAQSARKDGLPLPDERVTVGEYLDYWLDSAKRLGSIRRGTWENYESYVRLHLKPGIGRLPLAKLTPGQVQQFMATKLEAGASPNLVRYCRVVLRAALGQAAKEGLIARNVVTLTTPPKGARRTAGKPLTPDEARRLLDGLKGDRLRVLHTLMLILGLRQGEALGLRWSDLDLDGGMCHVRVELTRAAATFRLEELKTDRSRRDLPLNPGLIAILEDHKTDQNKERSAAGKAWADEWGLVFTTKNGHPIHSSTATHSFQRALVRLGIEKRRHYDLRHSTASLLINEGAELRDVMEQLGHSQIALTANTYGHIFMDRKKRLADKLTGLLQPLSDQPPQAQP